jgi:hypothetical protein
VPQPGKLKLEYVTIVTEAKVDNKAGSCDETITESVPMENLIEAGIVLHFVLLSLVSS